PSASGHGKRPASAMKRCSPCSSNAGKRAASRERARLAEIPVAAHPAPTSTARSVMTTASSMRVNPFCNTDSRAPRKAASVCCMKAQLHDPGRGGTASSRQLDLSALTAQLEPDRVRLYAGDTGPVREPVTDAIQPAVDQRERFFARA